MIDEKKLIETLEDYKNNDWNKKLYTSLPTVVDDCIDFVDNQPKIGEWIPCSERLPEESLNSVIGWDEYRQRCCFVQYYGGRWILGNDIDSVKIIAWQPLPDTYIVKHKDEKENE